MSKSKKELEQEIKILDTEIEWRTEKRNKLNIELMKKISPFKEGDVICWGNKKIKRKGRIISIDEWCCGIPKWQVVNIKKDGSEGEKAWVYESQKPDLLTATSHTEGKEG